MNATPLLVRLPTDRENSLSDPSQAIDLRRPENIVVKPFLTRNVVCRARPVVIPNRTLEEVWKAVFAFETYPSWNPYQRAMTITPSGEVIMRVNMAGPFDSHDDDKLPRTLPAPESCSIVKERLFLRDDARKILIYGFSSPLNVASSLRVLYLEPAEEGRNGVIYNSYVILGGYLSIVLDYFYKETVSQGFEAASRAFAEFLNGGPRPRSSLDVAKSKL